MQLPPDRISVNSAVNRDFWKVRGYCIHAKALAKIAREIDSHGFYGHRTALVYATEYCRMPPVVLFDQLLAQRFVHVHRFGHHPLTATHLA